MKSRKPRLTGRLQQAYSAVLRGATGAWYWTHPLAGNWGVPPSARQWQWQAYLFAKQWGGRQGVDLKRLEGIVARGPDPDCIVLFAKEVRGVNVRRSQREVVARGEPDAIRRFMSVKGANVESLKAVLIVAEVMAR